MLKYIAAALAPFLLIAIMFAASTAHAQDDQPREAQPLNGHPIRGYAEVCVTLTGHQEACQVFVTNDTFSSVDECTAQINARLHMLADDIHKQDAAAVIRAGIDCEPDQDDFNS